MKAEYLINPLNPLTWWKTGRYIQQIHPDLVFIQWWVTFFAPSLATIVWLATKSKISITFLVHNVLPHEERWWDRFLARIALRKGNRFIVHTPKEKERLLRVIPRAVVDIFPLPKFDLFKQYKVPQTEARNLLKVRSDLRTILFFGIVRHYKGLEDLIESVALLKKQGEKFFLIIAGEFWRDVTIYQKKIKDLHLCSQVRIENRYIPNEEVGTYFSAADALIVPYLAGTQSASAALGLGFGLPIIITETVASGLKESYPGQISIIPAKNPEALARAIQTIPANFHAPPQSCSVTDYDWNDFGDNLLRVYREH